MCFLCFPSVVCQVIGMYDYIAQNDDELPFGKGQIINVLSREDPDWWKGELNGSVGLFPSNYVKLTTDTDPSQQCESRRSPVSYTHAHTELLSIFAQEKKTKTNTDKTFLKIHVPMRNELA